ncbi:MAG: alpha/beta hydrolase [Alphaproteobacteria bacterium]|nr:alpha/beta hydrolase [Alphaproteobacteria bacterium]
MALNDSLSKADQIFTNTPVITTDDGRQVVVTPDSEYILPKHITLHEFHTHNGVPIRFYTAEAKNEKCMIMGASGYKTDFILNPAEVHALNEQGVSVCWLALPNPERNIGFMDYIMEAAEENLVNPRHAEIKKWCSRKVPKIFFGHSTGAQLFLRLATEGHHERFNQIFSGAVLSSPYITPPKTERPFAASTIAFNAYAAKHEDKLPSETPLGKAYLKKSERADFDGPSLAKYQVPTYGQIQELRAGGATVLNAIRSAESEIHELNIPFFVAAGAEDKFSSPKISAEIAQTFNGAFYCAEGVEHSPLSNNEDGFLLTREVIQAMASGTFEDFIAEKNLQDYNVKTDSFTLTRLALSALSNSTNASMLQLSLDRLRTRMPSVFSRTQP